MKWIDQLLVASYQKTRDETAFKLHYHRHATAMWNLAYNMVRGNKSEAEEITQDAWMRAIKGLEQFEWKSSLRTWLLAIVINRCKESYRKRNEHTDLDAIHNTHAISPADELELNDSTRLIQILPEGYRTILILHDLEGYQHHEIAAILDIAPGTSKSQLHQARKAFRKLYDHQQK